MGIFINFNRDEDDSWQKTPVQSPEYVYYRQIHPLEPIRAFDIIVTKDNLKDDFFIQEITKDGKILGRYLDQRFDGATVEYPHQDFEKIGLDNNSGVWLSKKFYDTIHT